MEKKQMKLMGETCMKYPKDLVTEKLLGLSRAFIKRSGEVEGGVRVSGMVTEKMEMPLTDVDREGVMLRNRVSLKRKIRNSSFGWVGLEIIVP